MPVNRVGALLASLRDTQLLEPETLDQVSRLPQARDEDPMPLTRELIQRGLLTPYQVNQLVKGNGKELVVGPYRLIDRIGEGGMGQVFKAYHPAMGRVVALKIIKKERLANPNAVKRFLQEIQSAAKLVSPNIVVAFDAGQIGETHYLAMEYVEGINLSKLVRTSGPLPVAEACEYVRQAAQGLQHAHERNMVHRDIKPGNLLLSRPAASPRGVVKILDMGLARLNDPDNTNALTRIGSVIGTPEYMAPEQAQDSHKADIRADLYSLGCTLYFLLTGRVPFKAATLADLLHKHQTEEPTPLEQVRPEAPLQLGLVVKKLMAKKPADRYQTPADLMLALTPFVPQGAVSGPSAAQITPTPAIPVMPRRKTGAQAAFANIGDDAPASRPAWKRRRSRRLVKLVAFLAVLGIAAGAALAYRPQLEQFFADLSSGQGKATVVASAKTTAPGTTREPATPGTGSDSEAKVDAKPQAKIEAPEPKPELKPEPKPAKPEPKKPTLPDAAKIAAAEKTVRDLYKKEFARKANDEMIALAGKLMEDAAGTKDDLALRYVLLREARDLGALAGNPDTMLKAIDELEKTYALDALEQKIAAFDKASKATNLPPVMRGLVEAIVKAVEEAVDSDNYDAARKLVSAALAAAKKANSAAMLTKVQNLDKEVTETANEFKSAKAARDKLETAPTDEGASFTWGRFLTYFKGHWGDGLPLLAGGSDEKVQTLAEKDRDNPKAAAEQNELGDGWYALGQAQKSALAKKNLWLRAKFWYEQAAPSLAGADKTKAEKRVKEIEALLPKEAPDSTASTSPMPKTTPKNEFDTLMQNGQALYRAGRYPEAAAAFNKALKLKPDNAKAQSGLKQAQYAEAIARGTMLANQGKLQEAASEFRKALDEVPNDPTAERYLNWTMTAQNGGAPGQSPFMRKGRGR
jgi:serine/threonine-protein kinase